MPHYRVAREWRDYVIAIDVVSCHTIRMVKAGVMDTSRASKRRARGVLTFCTGIQRGHASWSRQSCECTLGSHPREDAVASEAIGCRM